MNSPLHERIEAQFHALGRAQQKAATWLMKNTHHAVFMSIKEIAHASEVGDATVHRLFMDLNYSSFAEAKKEMQQNAYSLRTIRRLEKSQQAPPASWMKKALEVELYNFQLTFTAALEENIDKAADYLWQASKIYVAGWKMTASVAHSLSYALHFVFGNVTVIESASSLTEHVANMKEDCVLVAMQFPRYSKPITKLVQEANKAGATCILFADSPVAPSVSYCDVSLVSATESPGFLDSYVTPLLISQMIIQVIAHKHPDFVKQRLHKHEQLFSTFGIFRH